MYEGDLNLFGLWLQKKISFHNHLPVCKSYQYTSKFSIFRALLCMIHVFNIGNNMEQMFGLWVCCGRLIINSLTTYNKLHIVTTSVDLQVSSTAGVENLCRTAYSIHANTRISPCYFTKLLHNFLHSLLGI